MGKGDKSLVPPSDPEKVGEEYEMSSEAGGRGNWSNKMDFVLSCLSYAVGLGNVWRFPYVCYKNGGGVFLLPFCAMLFITGIPLVYLELSFGQYASSGVVSIWKVSPIFQGVGWAMFIVSCLICIYYNMIIAWTIYYLFASFTDHLPWSDCGEWSSEACVDDMVVKNNCTKNNGTWFNSTCVYPYSVDNATYSKIQEISGNIKHISASEEYFHKYVLDITSSMEEMGGLRWELAACLLAAWVLVDICLAKGIKSSGKAVYFTAFFPYLVLTILLVRGVTLEGASDGIIYYLKPDWSQLAEPRVWKEAAVQIFFSLSPCWGGLITLASYNKFHNNCLFDAILVSILDCVTSVFAGLVIFSIIGYMANELQQSVEQVAADGPGLAFVLYPTLVTKLPISQLWSVMFFAMLITLGLGTQISTVTTVHTTLLDQFAGTFRKRSLLLLIAISIAGYLIGLSFCTQGGMYVVTLFDNYAATYSLLAIGLVECCALSWVYGTERLFQDIELMLGSRPGKIWAISWHYIAPIALFAILIFTWVDFIPSKYNGYIFPMWAEGIGFGITLMSVVAIPIVALFKIVMAMRETGDGFVESAVKLSKPLEDWGPRLKEHRMLMKASQSQSVPLDTFESTNPMLSNGYNPNSEVPS